MRFISAPRTRDLLATALAAASLLPATHSQAQVSWTGDIDPSDPTTWTTSTDGYVGKTAIGTLDILTGGTVDTRSAYVGYETGSEGIVTVSDPGSLWTIDSTFYVGYRGSGLLNIASGGVVNVEQRTYLGWIAGSSGVINFNNGTLNTRNLFASPDKLMGTGTINTSGLISDIDIVFDAANGPQQTKMLNALPGQNITLNVDADGPTLGSWGAGYDGSASLTIADGQALSAASSYLGYQTGSNGTATVTGAGSAWDVSGTLFVGYLGTGTLNIESGGAVAVTGDTWVGAQPTASGSINLNNGTFQTTSLFAAAADLLGTGTINANGLITDIDLVFDASNGLVQTKTLNALPGQNITLNIDYTNAGKVGAGYRDSGSLTVADGMDIRVRNIDLGFHAGSNGTAIVTGTGSALTNAFWVTVGRSGDGDLTIADGGSVSGLIGYLGQINGATGTLTVTGAGSTYNIGSLHVGLSGTGFLTIEDGGEIASRSGLIGSRVGSSGTATVAGVGSIWNVDTLTRIGNSGEGSLTVENGGTLSTSDLYVGHEQAGILDIATGGYVEVKDDLFFESSGGTASLNYVLSSTTDPLIDVADDVQLAGTLNVDLNAGTSLSVGDTFTLIDIAGAQTGAFSNAGQGDSLGIFDGLALILDYAGGDGNDVVAHAAFLGDANLDGEVSLLDLDILGQYYNEVGTWSQGDFNGDGEVSLIDLDLLGQNYGTGQQALSRAQMLAYIGQPVPEPSSLALVGLGGLLIARRRRG